MRSIKPPPKVIVRPPPHLFEPIQAPTQDFRQPQRDPYRKSDVSPHDDFDADVMEEMRRLEASLMGQLTSRQTDSGVTSHQTNRDIIRENSVRIQNTNLNDWKREGYPSEYAYAQAMGALAIKRPPPQEQDSIQRDENHMDRSQYQGATPLQHNNSGSTADPTVIRSADHSLRLGLHPHDEKAARRAKQLEYKKQLDTAAAAKAESDRMLALNQQKYSLNKNFNQNKYENAPLAHNHQRIDGPYQIPRNIDPTQKYLDQGSSQYHAERAHPSYPYGTGQPAPPRHFPDGVSQVPAEPAHPYPTVEEFRSRDVNREQRMAPNFDYPPQDLPHRQVQRGVHSSDIADQYPRDGYQDMESVPRNFPHKPAMLSGAGQGVGPTHASEQPQGSPSHVRSRMVSDVYGANGNSPGFVGVPQGAAIDDRWRPSGKQGDDRQRAAMNDQKAALDRQIQEDKRRKEELKRKEKEEDEKQERKIQESLAAAAEEERRNKAVQKEAALVDLKKAQELQEKRLQEAKARKGRGGTDKDGEIVSARGQGQEKRDGVAGQAGAAGPDGSHEQFQYAHASAHHPQLPPEQHIPPHQYEHQEQMRRERLNPVGDREIMDGDPFGYPAGGVRGPPAMTDPRNNNQYQDYHAPRNYPEGGPRGYSERGYDDVRDFDSEGPRGEGGAGARDGYYGDRRDQHGHGSMRQQHWAEPRGYDDNRGVYDNRGGGDGGYDNRRGGDGGYDNRGGGGDGGYDNRGGGGDGGYDNRGGPRGQVPAHLPTSPSAKSPTQARSRLITDVYGSAAMNGAPMEKEVNDRWRPSGKQGDDRQRAAMNDQKAALDRQIQEDKRRKEELKRKEKEEDEKQERKIQESLAAAAEEERRNKAVQREQAERDLRQAQQVQEKKLAEARRKGKQQSDNIDHNQPHDGPISHQQSTQRGAPTKGSPPRAGGGPGNVMNSPPRAVGGAGKVVHTPPRVVGQGNNSPLRGGGAGGMGKVMNSPQRGNGGGFAGGFGGGSDGRGQYQHPHEEGPAPRVRAPPKVAPPIHVLGANGSDRHDPHAYPPRPAVDDYGDKSMLGGSLGRAEPGSYRDGYNDVSRNGGPIVRGMGGSIDGSIDMHRYGSVQPGEESWQPHSYQAREDFRFNPAFGLHDITSSISSQQQQHYSKASNRDALFRPSSAEEVDAYLINWQRQASVQDSYRADSSVFGSLERGAAGHGVGHGGSMSVESHRVDDGRYPPFQNNPRGALPVAGHHISSEGRGRGDVRGSQDTGGGDEAWGDVSFVSETRFISQNKWDNGSLLTALGSQFVQRNTEDRTRQAQVQAGGEGGGGKGGLQSSSTGGSKERNNLSSRGMDMEQSLVSDSLLVFLRAQTPAMQENGRPKSTGRLPSSSLSLSQSSVTGHDVPQHSMPDSPLSKLVRSADAARPRSSKSAHGHGHGLDQHPRYADDDNSMNVSNGSSIAALQQLQTSPRSLSRSHNSATGNAPHTTSEAIGSGTGTGGKYSSAPSFPTDRGSRPNSNSGPRATMKTSATASIYADTGLDSSLSASIAIHHHGIHSPRPPSGSHAAGSNGSDTQGRHMPNGVDDKLSLSVSKSKGDLDALVEPIDRLSHSNRSMGPPSENEDEIVVVPRSNKSAGSTGIQKDKPAVFESAHHHIGVKSSHPQSVSNSRATSRAISRSAYSDDFNDEDNDGDNDDPIEPSDTSPLGRAVAAQMSITHSSPHSKAAAAGAGTGTSIASSSVRGGAEESEYDDDVRGDRVMPSSPARRTGSGPGLAGAMGRRTGSGGAPRSSALGGGRGTAHSLKGDDSRLSLHSQQSRYSAASLHSQSDNYDDEVFE